MSEYTEALGKRVQLREERAGLVAEIDALRKDLRGELNPVLDADEVDGGKVATLAFALNDKLERLAAIDAKLTAIKEIVGR